MTYFTQSTDLSDVGKIECLCGIHEDTPRPQKQSMEGNMNQKLNARNSAMTADMVTHKPVERLSGRTLP